MLSNGTWEESDKWTHPLNGYAFALCYHRMLFTHIPREPWSLKSSPSCGCWKKKEKRKKDKLAPKRQKHKIKIKKVKQSHPKVQKLGSPEAHGEKPLPSLRFGSVITSTIWLSHMRRREFLTTLEESPCAGEVGCCHLSNKQTSPKPLKINRPQNPKRKTSYLTRKYQ